MERPRVLLPALLLVGFAFGGVAPAATGVELSEATGVALRRLDLPTGEPARFDVVVAWHGESRTLRLRRHSLRDPRFRVRVWNGEGDPREAQAPAPAIYRGFVVDDPSIRVVADLTAEGLNATIVPAEGSMISVRPLPGEKRSAGAVRHRVRVEDADAASWFFDGCPEDLLFPEDAERHADLRDVVRTAGEALRSHSGQHLAQIAFDVDYQYYLLKGASIANSVAAVEAIMNQVDFFYARDVLISYSITDVIVRTSQFYFPTGGGDLLDQFRAEWNTNQAGIVRDLAHLMTNKDNIEFGGLAWVGTVCTDSGYGWSLDGANIVGHEVGHNWGAGHCHDVSPCNNMCGACFWVAPRTKEIISAFRDSRTCLDDVGPYASPLPPYAHPESDGLTRDEVAAQAMRGFDVLANDHDGNFDPLSIDGFQEVSERGAGIALSPGTGGAGRDELVYTASGEVFAGDDRFEYTVGDGTGLQATGEVTVRVSAPALVGYWKLDDGAGASAADASGGNRVGQISGNAGWVVGPHGGALDFDGVDDDVTVPPLNREMTSATITAWVLRNGPQSPWAGMVFSREGNTLAGLNLGGANELRYHWNGTASSYNWDSGLVVPDRRWAFVALVVEPDRATMYLDDGAGLQSAVNTVPHEPEEFDGAIHLGQDPSGGRMFAGSLDDVRIYNYALGASEIAALHDLGGKAHAPRPADGGRLLPSVGKLGWSAGLGATSHDVYFGTDFLAVRDATPASAEYRGNETATSVIAPAPLDPAVNYYWRVDEINGGDVVTGDVWLFSLGAPAGHWKLDETSGAVAADSGGALDGAYLGTPLLDQDPAQPQLGRAVRFDGFDDSVRIPGLALDSASVTLSAWVRREGDQSPFSGILFSRAGSTTAGLNVGNANELRYHWNDGYWDWDSGLVLPDAEWVFVALVLEPTRATVFMGQGGVLLSAANYAFHGPEEFDGPFYLGQDPTGGRYFDGLLDDVRVYGHALSAADVGELYLASGVAAGRIPDGSAVPGAPLLLDRMANGDVSLSWSASCVGSDADYVVYEGTLGQSESHEPVECSTGGATSWTFSPLAGSAYYLVVPRSVNREGAYGNRGDGQGRPQSGAACLPQYISDCD